jgi:hypothetical protein
MATVQPLAHSVKGAADAINASKGLLYNAIRLYAKDPERGLACSEVDGTYRHPTQRFDGLA